MGRRTSAATPWLLGIARRVIANHRRSDRRRRDVNTRLTRLSDAARPAEDAGLLATQRAAALEALAALPDDQREALLLVAWRVEGRGVNQTLPIRSDSHGYGAELLGAVHAKSLMLTFIDAKGKVLGSRTVPAVT